MTRAYVEFDPGQPDAPDFDTETTDLVYFLSWAYSARFGASHDLSLLARVLDESFHIDLEPLLTFADREIEAPIDAVTLEMAWQEPQPLAACCEAVTAALRSGDERLPTVQTAYPTLADSIEALGRMAWWAAERGCKVRLSYELTNDLS